MLIQTKLMRDFLSTNLFFEENHSTYDRFVQRFIKKKNEIKTISFINNLSLQQNEEDKVFDEYSLTDVITNDIAKILLNFFVS
jgi:hypothetical protein